MDTDRIREALAVCPVEWQSQGSPRRIVYCDVRQRVVIEAEWESGLLGYMTPSPYELSARLEKAWREALEDEGVNVESEDGDHFLYRKEDEVKLYYTAQVEWRGCPAAQTFTSYLDALTAGVLYVFDKEAPSE